MPRGALPKIYPQEMVDAVERLYSEGKTQVEVAAALGTTQKVIWRLMVRHSIAARVAAKRDQRGSANHMWRGDEAGYQALHLRVESARGTPSRCEDCGTTKGRFEWVESDRQLRRRQRLQATLPSMPSNLRRASAP